MFTRAVAGHKSISIVPRDGGTPQEVISQGAGSDLTATFDGRTIVFSLFDPAHLGLWKVTDGGRPVQLTAGPVGWPRITRDDRQVVFISPSASVQSLWMVSINGGTPIQVTNRFAAGPALSPDGKTVSFASQDDQNHPVHVVCNLPDCSSPRFLARPPGSVSRFVRPWTPDGQGLTYVTGTPQNLWVQRLDGKPSRQLTHFTDDREIADVAWSRDGKRLAIARTTTTDDIVLFKGLKR
jgi:Tol biopolymer transport system component